MTALTATALADALDAFHNAAIGHAHGQSYGGPSTPMDVATIISVGFNMMAAQLRESQPKPLGITNIERANFDYLISCVVKHADKFPVPSHMLVACEAARETLKRMVDYDQT